MTEFDKVYETIPGNGWLTKNEAELLWQCAKVFDGPILEVGCYQGRSTVLLASFGRLVYAVDPFSNFDSDDMSGAATYSKFLENIESRHIHNVILSRMKVEEWDHRPIGFAYLDGDHTYAGTITQLRVAKQCGARAVCVHDYMQSGDGVHIVKAIKDSEYEVLRVTERMAYCKVSK